MQGHGYRQPDAVKGLTKLQELKDILQEKDKHE